MIRGLDFISIPVRDLARAVTFYRDTLGLRLLTQSEDKWAELEMPDGNTICLYPPEAYGMTFSPVKTLTLGVDDVTAASNVLAARGVIPPEGTAIHDSGVCFGLEFQDTEGNSLHLHHRYGPET